MLNTIFCKQILAYIFNRKKLLFNEKEKMLAGKVYNPSLDYNLFKERLQCKTLCYKYNNLSPDKVFQRNNLISKIIGKVGKVFYLEQPFMCDYGYNIEFGENFCSNHNLLILDAGKVTFGNNVMVGPNCEFYATMHPLNTNRRLKGLQWANPITICNNVWICGNVTVLGGVTIGENSIIGAGSVVTRDVPPNSLAVGSPCKVIKSFVGSSFSGE